MDKNADREPNYWLWQIDPEEDRYEPWIVVSKVNPLGQVMFK